MTRFDPSLALRRFVVLCGSEVAYDENFHLGVNILRGDNSSGKSTILNMIYYGIGGDVSDWSPAALNCSKVFAEVLLNGKVATLARDIKDKSGQPMEIFSGPVDEARSAPASAWARYPYRRQERNESFSQAIFRLLKIPEATSEASGNVTMHQMLRLMYADQLSPVGTIFKFEQFDPPSLREAVGRLIFGTFENELYANGLKIKELNKELEKVSAELSSMFSLLSGTSGTITLAWLEAEKSKITSLLKQTEEELEKAEEVYYKAKSEDPISIRTQQDNYVVVRSLQEEISLIQITIDNLRFEIADADLFIRDLDNKLKSLQDSSKVSEFFGDISFQYCPACYSVVEPDPSPHACHLCKTPYESERAQTRIVGLVNDTARQLRQSNLLQKDREEELRAANRKLSEARAQWEKASKALGAATRLPSGETRSHIRELQRKVGYLERQLEDISEKEKMMSVVSDLSNRKAALSSDISKLRDRNSAIESAVSNRLSVAYTNVESEILNLLHKDLPREDAFINARHVQFEFSSNNLSVDGQSYFSASSRVILRNSFFLGLLAASLKDRHFRHLRYCMFDSIEDKGMQDERSHNYQKLIVDISRKSKTEHQIIFGTSMIAPDLDTEEFTIGDRSTAAHKTLRIRNHR